MLKFIIVIYRITGHFLFCFLFLMFKINVFYTTSAPKTEDFFWLQQIKEK